LLERAQVVLGVLQRPVPLELDVAVRVGQALVDDAVRVRIDAARELAAVVDRDQHGPSRLGAEVDADRVEAVAHAVWQCCSGAGNAGTSATSAAAPSTGGFMEPPSSLRLTARRPPSARAARSARRTPRRRG